MKAKTFEELVQLKQNGKIGWCEFALLGEHAAQYIQWCDDHGVEPDDINAEVFLEQTEENLYEDTEPVAA